MSVTSNETHDELMFAEGGDLKFAQLTEPGKAWWRSVIYQRSGLIPRELAFKLAGGRLGDFAVTWTRITDKGASLLIERSGWNDERYDLTDDRLVLLGPAFFDARMFAAPSMDGPGRLFGMLDRLSETARAFGARHIGTDAIRTGRYALIRAGFLPDQLDWEEIKPQVMLQLVLRESAFPAGAALEVMRRLERSGPRGCRFVAALSLRVPSSRLPEKFGVPERVPFGRAFFIEECGDWWARLDLADRASVAIAGEAAVESHPSVFAPIHQTMVPKDVEWGFLEAKPNAPIGAAGPAWRNGAAQAWCDAGGTIAAFDDIFSDGEPAQAPIIPYPSV